MAGETHYEEGRDFRFKPDNTLVIKRGDWKIEAKDEWVTVYHGNSYMLKCDHRAFNHLFSLFVDLSGIAEQLRREGRGDANSPVTQ